MDYINRFHSSFKMSGKIETNLLCKAGITSIAYATEVPSTHNEKWNVRSSQVCSLRNVAMGGHQSVVWRPSGACGVRTEDC